jgi:hypothetical protein
MTQINNAHSEKLLQTALSFKQLFENSEQMTEQSQIPEREKLRFKAILGFTALDAIVSLIWNLEVIPDWDDVCTLLDAAVEQKSQVRQILKNLEVKNNHSQVIASLRFIQNTSDMGSFAPTFVDLALIFALRAGQKNLRTELASVLFDLQKFRNACIHTAKYLDLSEMQQANNQLQLFFQKTEQLHPLFKDISFSNSTPQKKAA